MVLRQVLAVKMMMESSKVLPPLPLPLDIAASCEDHDGMSMLDLPSAS